MPETVPSYTKQEIFDIVSVHLLSMDGRSMHYEPEPFPTEGSCAYRGNDGKKCAVGVLIPDSLYDPVWDQNVYSINNLLERDEFYPWRQHLSLLEALQSIHDFNTTWNKGTLINDLTRLAGKHDVSTNVMNAWISAHPNL